ncbi:YciI family protein [Kribbella qitaiheensis]|uniref:YciI family protein n=1 Tax=Kribbella qitaiheensis TaxID=1544730 RepID=A0A7G6X783_9ACTN|nr:YciI family protein [Kribbella qitaiheensis]QNE22098.1 YciI family protein [Kribbella qitaiheensis]
MRVMVLVQTDPKLEDTYFEDPRANSDLEAMGRFNDELLKAGVMLAGEGLAPSREGKRVSFGTDGPSVVDGPFAEAKELIGGYWIWQVESMEEAVEWIKRGPFHEGTLELRRVYEEAEFADGYPQPK